MDDGLAILERERLNEVVARCIAGFRLSSGVDFPKRPLDALGWFGEWFGDEDVAQSQPFSIGLKSAIEKALGVSVIDLQRTGVVNVSVLAKRLGVPDGIAIERVEARLNGKPFRGPYVPASLASEIETRAREWHQDI